MPRRMDEENILERERLGYGDTMSTVEIDAIISKAHDLDYMGLSGVAWSCLFTILWAFGKRISEIVELRTTDVTVRDMDLVITFSIRKKRDGKRPRMSKRLTLSNKYARLIEAYWSSIKDKGGYLFPRKETKMGHIYPRYVFDAINLMEFEQPIWTHLFRHTLATELAQNEVGAFEMKTWFDWEKIDTADSYVSAAGVSTKKVSSRKW